MIHMAAGKFKAKCLKLMEQVRRTHEEIVITKFGRPVAKLVPTQEADRKPLFGLLRNRATYRDNLVSPTGERWAADV